MTSSSDIQTWEVKEPYLKLHCKLGEGPYYERATNTLRFVDIIQRRLHTVSLEKGPESLVTQQLDTPISVTADIAGVDPRDKILIGAKFGVAVLDRKAASDKKDAYEYVAKFHKMKDNLRLRGNDGAVDPHGRFWLGTMTDFELGPFQSEGMQIHSLYSHLTVLAFPTSSVLRGVAKRGQGVRAFKLTPSRG